MLTRRRCASRDSLLCHGSLECPYYGDRTTHLCSRCGGRSINAPEDLIEERIDETLSSMRARRATPEEVRVLAAVIRPTLTALEAREHIRSMYLVLASGSPLFISHDDVATLFERARAVHAERAYPDEHILHSTLVALCYEPWTCGDIFGSNSTAMCYHGNMGELPCSSEPIGQLLARNVRFIVSVKASST